MSSPCEPPATWQVHFHPHNPTLVEFCAYRGELLQGRHRARWLGPARGWDPQYWRPTSPPLPAAMLQATETLLRDGQHLASHSRL